MSEQKHCVLVGDLTFIESVHILQRKKGVEGEETGPSVLLVIQTFHARKRTDTVLRFTGCFHSCCCFQCWELSDSFVPPHAGLSPTARFLSRSSTLFPACPQVRCVVETHISSLQSLTSPSSFFPLSCFFFLVSPCHSLTIAFALHLL